MEQKNFYQLSLKHRVYWTIVHWKSAWINHFRLSTIYLSILGKNKRFVIQNSFGRTGNNFQQLMVGLAHAIKYKGTLVCPPGFSSLGGLELPVEWFPCNLERKNRSIVTFSSNFFHYTENRAFSRGKVGHIRPSSPARKETFLQRGYLEKNLHHIARKHLTPYVKPRSISSEKLVLHLRSGDISNLKSLEYITYPSAYYRRLAARYEKVIIVTENGTKHPLLDEICSYFQYYEIASNSVEDDFSLLCSASSLAISCVGTFAVAAALISPRLRFFHSSDIYMHEHLNPSMLHSRYVHKDIVVLPGFTKAWRNSSDRLSLLREFDNIVESKSRPVRLDI